MTLYRKEINIDTGDLTGDWYSMEFDVGGNSETVVFVPVEPTATWFTIEDADDERFCELWALGKVKPVPLGDDDE